MPIVQCKITSSCPIGNWLSNTLNWCLHLCCLCCHHGYHGCRPYSPLSWHIVHVFREIEHLPKPVRKCKGIGCIVKLGAELPWFQPSQRFEWDRQWRNGGWTKPMTSSVRCCLKKKGSLSHLFNVQYIIHHLNHICIYIRESVALQGRVQYLHLWWHHPCPR